MSMNNAGHTSALLSLIEPLRCRPLTRSLSSIAFSVNLSPSSSTGTDDPRKTPSMLS
jgi:hypothetical protein